MLAAVDLGITDDSEGASHEQAAQIGSPCLLILPSLSRPPLECCFGTNPIQAEKLRPDRKVLGSATLATKAVPSSGPTPGMQLRRLLVRLERCQAMIIRSTSKICCLSLR